MPAAPDDCPVPERECPLLGPNGWDRWRGEVSEQIRMLGCEHRETQRLLRDVREQLAGLKGRAAGVGATAGFVVTAITEIITYILRR